MAEAYPLQWPDGWPRTQAFQRCKSRYKIDANRAARGLFEAIRKLGASRDSVVVSTNVRPQSFANRSTVRPIEDPGVAVYWSTHKHGERVIACDRWLSVYENIHAIELAVEALRAIERAGATQILERAFAAFGALPASPDATPKRPWWEVFDIPEAFIPALSLPMVKAKYRELTAQLHPDRTGNPDSLTEINAAMREAEEHYSQ